MSFYKEHGKRIFDIVLSIIGLMILLPVFIIISILIKLNGDMGPIFFTQKRIGKNGKVFTLYKFRTMLVDTTTLGHGVTSGNDNRITKLGRFFRKYKLDELPQLLNVFIGHMSIVGPRPESGRYINEYKEDYSYILQIKPGLTDFATIQFRDEEDMLANYDDVEEAYIKLILPEKIKLYKKYISEMSFIVDLKIVYRTLVEIIRI